MIPKVGERLYVVEREDELGTYCLVYNESTPPGEEATYDNLEAAAKAIVGYRFSTNEKYDATVYFTDEEEYERFVAAEAKAEDEYLNIMFGGSVRRNRGAR